MSQEAIDALRAKLQQLQALHAGGSLGAEAYAEARSKLERELVDRVMAEEAAPPAPKVPRRLQATLALGVLVLAGLGYSFTGSPTRLALGPEPSTATASASANGDPPITDAQVAELVDKVAQRLKDKPDDAAGWTLLARAYSAMGRMNDAVPAFQKALALTGEDATLMADYADARASQNNGRLDAEGLKLIERALVLEPANVKALALSGSAAFDQGDYPAAVRQWEKVERGLPADSNILPQVRASIAQARQLGGMPAVAAAPATQASVPPSGGVAARPGSVSGRVTLAPALAARVGPNDTVFVLARPANGPRMPLAVLRKQVKDLPLDFMLDDSMAMAPTAKISDHAQVIVSARISKSGDALPQAGDFSGQSVSVAPGASGITVTIADVVGQ